MKPTKTPFVPEDKAVKRVEDPEIKVMNLLHEFGREWMQAVANEWGPLERKGLKRRYYSEIFDAIIKHIEEETRLSAEPLSPPHAKGD